MDWLKVTVPVLNLLHRRPSHFRLHEPGTRTVGRAFDGGWDVEGSFLTRLANLDDYQGSKEVSTSSLVSAGVRLQRPGAAWVVEATAYLSVLVSLDASALGVEKCLETKDTKRSFLDSAFTSCNPPLEGR